MLQTTVLLSLSLSLSFRENAFQETIITMCFLESVGPVVQKSISPEHISKIQVHACTVTNSSFTQPCVGG